MGSTIGFQCPYFHFTKALAAELGLAAERLLSYQGVWTGRTSVNLVLNQVN